MRDLLTSILSSEWLNCTTINTVVAVVSFIAGNTFKAFLPEKLRYYFEKERNRVASDRDLYGELLNTFRPTQEFLFVVNKRHCKPFGEGDLGNIDSFSEQWENVSKKFHDDEIERLKVRLVESVDLYSNKLADCVFPLHPDDPITYGIDPKLKRENPDLYSEQIDELNTLAKKVVQAYRALIEKARKKGLS